MKYLGFLLCVFLFSCEKGETNFVNDNAEFARMQIGKEIEVIEAGEKFINPITLNKEGAVYYGNYTDWRSGFFPGSIWYLYELTGDQSLLPFAQKYTEAIKSVKDITSNHDVGFMAYCSFGNGLRLTNNPEYKNVIIDAAKSLSTRFRPVPGITQSWDVIRGWPSQRGWECPVIIDNMMNLELMFAATRLSGDSSFYHIAVSHANRTLKEQFRPDGSCYHVIDYSLDDGSVRNRHTAQGYAHESAWSRGIAWGIYGLTVCYRETGDRKYIDQALKSAQFMLTHKNLPEDLIFYWDMDAPDIPNTYRDASSAAVIASALYEISTMDVADALSYKAYADRIMENLASPAYRAELGTNGNFLLKHSVGSIPHNAEIDVPLNYADYYFLEALTRKRGIEEKNV